MKAALKTESGEFEIKDVPTPEIPDPNWVLARVRVSGICGTDLRHWKKPKPELVGKIMGHELSGEVVEIGSAVKHVKVGDRVVIETLLGCGDCDWCRVQQYNLCPRLYEVRVKSVSRAFAEYVVGPAEKFHKLPDEVSFEDATLLDTYSVCLHGLHLSGLRVNQSAAIIGAGPIGCGQVQLVKQSGAYAIVTDPVDHSLQVAKELGADLVINPKKEDAREKIMEFTRGRGVDMTFECAGGPQMPRTLPEAVSFTRIGGKVVLIGGFENGNVAIELDWQQLQKREIQLIPSASYAFWDIDPEMRICIEMMAKGKLTAKKVITHTFPLDEINKAFETANEKTKNKSIFVGLLS